MRDVVLSLVASVIAGSAVWLGQRLLRYRRLARRRAFFGVVPGASCLLVPPRHFSSPRPQSVHRRDLAALVELATVVNAGGGRIEIADERTGLYALGRTTEFCVGGPIANLRAATHLRALLPGVAFDPPETEKTDIAFSIGPTTYRRTPPQGRAAHEYVVLAKVRAPDAARPVFIVAGQTAVTNLAAARFLVTGYPRLLKRYGAAGRFCLVLRVNEPEAYGPDLVEVAADATGTAFAPPDPAHQRGDLYPETDG